MLNMDWNRFRQFMPITRRWVYLDHSAVAPLPAPGARAMVNWSQEATSQGDTVWPQWYRRLGEVRQRQASMLNAGLEEIALVPSTTSGIGLVAEGYPWRAGENVVTLENEFPSNLYPWMNLADRGVQTRCVAVPGGHVDLNRIAEACDVHTRIVAVSWVGYASGWRVDVAELARLAHDHGALLLVDAIQGLGVFRWMCGRPALIFWRRMVTSGCWGRKAPACSICGASTWICCVRWASAGTACTTRSTSARWTFGCVRRQPVTREAARTWWGSSGWVRVWICCRISVSHRPSHRWPGGCCRSPTWRCPGCDRWGRRSSHRATMGTALAS